MIQSSRPKSSPRFSQRLQKTSGSGSKTPRRFLTRWLAAGAMTSAALLLGVVPSLHPSQTGNSAYAQSAVSDAEVQNYAQSVLDIERLRRNASSQMRSVLGADAQIPSIACNRPETLNNQRREVRQIAVDYCTESTRIVEGNSLSTTRFNAITEAQLNDTSLADRIRRALIQLQRGATP